MQVAGVEKRYGSPVPEYLPTCKIMQSDGTGYQLLNNGGLKFR